MPDRTSAGCDLLPSQIFKAVNFGIAWHEDREAFVALADGPDGLDRDVGRRGKGKGRIADQPGIDRAGTERFQQRCGRRKLLPFDLVRHILENASSFHHRLRVPLLITDPQNGLSIRGGNCTQQNARNEPCAHHSAATLRAAPRSAISLRVNGINSRPYSMASISGSKPRIRKWLTPRS